MFALPSAHVALLECWRTDNKGSAMLSTRKIVVDFSLAAAAAALIGVAVGGSALSFVWLLAVLNR